MAVDSVDSVAGTGSVVEADWTEWIEDSLEKTGISLALATSQDSHRIFFFLIRELLLPTRARPCWAPGPITLSPTLSLHSP